MISFPDWYQGGYTDAEKAFYCMLYPYGELTDPKIEIVTWRQWRGPGDGPVALLYRNGGASEGVLDEPIMELAVFSEDRDVSMQVTEYLRQAVLTFRSSGGVVKAAGIIADEDPGFSANIKGADDHMGPQLISDKDDVDARVVFSSYRLCLRQPRGLPNYDNIRDQVIP
ncbi:hypothetical protein [Tsukamurella tyrosinosolvens]|uniref:phage tail termination protein n=1 Tax=Tsukamurella tyrosinosolvens TaxID=57704 RepID=UPI003462D50B